MSLAYSLKDAENKINEWNLPLAVKNQLRGSQWSLRELSTTIGMHENFLSQQINRKNISLPLLFILSVYLRKNMFEPVLQLLPEHVRGTAREAELEAGIARLNAELADVKKERDIYKEIALKRSL